MKTASVAVAEHRGLSPVRAVNAWLQACGRAEGLARLPMVSVSIADALGSVLAEPVWALRSSPGFPAAAMDGIAVSAAHTLGASVGSPVRLTTGRFEVVDTGNPVPSGRDAVVMRERVNFDGDVAAIETEVRPGQHVRPIGEDLAAGELLLTPGHRLRPTDLAAAAAAGVMKLVVRRAARVAILPTGDELRPADAVLAPGELADTNSLMLDGLAREAGCETRVWPILPDDPNQLAEALLAATEQADIVLLVAGTSAGRHDYAPEVIRRCGKIVVQGVAMRPGHPAVLGVVEGTPVMACPGYPVSAAVAFEELARPLVATLEGAGVPSRPVVRARLGADVRSKRGARQLLRVRVGTVDGRRVAMPLRGGASVLTSLVHADALVPVANDLATIPATAPVDAELLPGALERRGALLLGGAPERALELLAVAFAEEHERHGRMAFCEIAAPEAVRLVREGLCHAAAVSGRAGLIPRSDRQLLRVRLAECNVGLVIAPGRLPERDPLQLLQGRVRIASGPQGTPARRVLDEVVGRLDGPGLEILETRSDAAALATVGAGYADGAVSTAPAAAHAGLTATTLGRAAIDLVIGRGAAERDPVVRVLLQTMRSRPLGMALEQAGYEPGVDRPLHIQSDRSAQVPVTSASYSKPNLNSSTEVME